MSPDPLLHSERTQGFAADPDYWKGEVFAYVGLPQNLKDLKHQSTTMCSFGTGHGRSLKNSPLNGATTLIRISFPSPSGGEVGVGFMWF